MKLHELKSAEGSCRVCGRAGRGAGPSSGETSARGQKGQKVHSSDSVRPGLGGGQLPLFRHLSKRGFTNINRKEYAIVNPGQLNQFKDGTEITPALLVETGMVKNEKSGIKALGNGSLDKKLTVRAHRFSASTAEAVDAKGGAHEMI